MTRDTLLCESHGRRTWWPAYWTADAPACWDCGQPATPRARCGRTDPHGGHADASRPWRFCVGNVHVVTAQDGPCCERFGPEGIHAPDCRRYFDAQRFHAQS